MPQLILKRKKYLPQSICKIGVIHCFVNDFVLFSEKGGLFANACIYGERVYNK
ncbi:hypothetical protein FD47_GL002236 [Lentilactobacillus parafarraginis DSM 18390 = JCM 14109]|uniref:Uncharacterized protein n=1 Tax=Lentilactobacillus parafarraginis DSM 18390 = JCM 14109 TaxID=1423786 RepID=A0A0R1YPN9_9LACO|nr:hypothetical protein FD47_GL002236 [Lentilactobacillus parafarraginis DSM 18390 = JCM 14109]